MEGSLVKLFNRSLWGKHWPLWRILLAICFAIAFFGSESFGVGPNDLRTKVPVDYDVYWVVLSAIALIVFMPLAIGPNWREQGIFNSFLAVGFLVYWAFSYPQNLVARIYVEREMAFSSDVTITPTEFELYSIDERPDSRGRHYVANFRSKNGIATWRPAGWGIERSQIGYCVTLMIRRNSKGAILIERLDGVVTKSFHRCAT